MPITFNQQVIAGTVNGAATTHTQHLQHAKGYGVQIAYTLSGSTGLAKLQASNNGTDFIDIPDSEVAIAASGSFYYDVQEANYTHVKVVCESTSGDITFSVWFTIKKVPKLH